MRAAVIPLLLLMASACQGGEPMGKADAKAAAPRLSVRQVVLDESDPSRRRVGALLFIGGYALASDDPRFGGISAMNVAGGKVIAVSDRGSIINITLPAENSPPELSIRTIPQGPPPGHNGRDSEAMVVEGGKAWVGFEGADAVWRYTLPAWRNDAHASPAPMKRWRGNSGSEAMVRLKDGRFLVFDEGRDGVSRPSDALLFDGDPAVEGTKVARLRYRAPLGYRITDAALLPDGRILFLNRRFKILEGVSTKLTVGTLPKAVEEGAVLTGAEIADLRPPLTVDNMEALSVTQEGGRTIIWVGSDDNFSFLQRTLLLKFALVEERESASAR